MFMPLWHCAQNIDLIFETLVKNQKMNVMQVFIIYHCSFLMWLSSKVCLYLLVIVHPVSILFSHASYFYLFILLLLHILHFWHIVIWPSMIYPRAPVCLFFCFCVFDEKGNVGRNDRNTFLIVPAYHVYACVFPSFFRISC